MFDSVLCCFDCDCEVVFHSVPRCSRLSDEFPASSSDSLGGCKSSSLRAVKEWCQAEQTQSFSSGFRVFFQEFSMSFLDVCYRI